MREPQQARSRQTAEAIVTAAESILESKSFRTMTLDELVSEAGCTVGAFYHLFENKASLLNHLEERFYLGAHAIFDRLPTTAGDAQGLELLRILAVELTNLYFDWRGSLRALLLEAETRPDLRDRMNKRSMAVLERAAGFLVPRLGLPEPCVRDALLVAAAAQQGLLRKAVLDGSSSLFGVPVAREVLYEEVARLGYGYFRERCGSSATDTSGSP